MLEQQMQELRELPARVAGVELQILQLRDEMQSAFSAIRSELHGEVGSLRGEVGSLHGEVGSLHGEVGSLHGRMDGLRDELRAEMHGIRDDLRTETQGAAQKEARPARATTAVTKPQAESGGRVQAVEVFGNVGDVG